MSKDFETREKIAEVGRKPNGQRAESYLKIIVELLLKQEERENAKRDSRG